LSGIGRPDIRRSSSRQEIGGLFQPTLIGLSARASVPTLAECKRLVIQS
jgi:hypothetical protein